MPVTISVQSSGPPLPPPLLPSLPFVCSSLRSEQGMDGGEKRGRKMDVCVCVRVCGGVGR